MSHELRTPLNAIILYSELLQELAADREQDSSAADLQRINAAGKHLLELINGILDLSKIEAGKMALSLESFNVKTLVEGIADTMAPLVRKNNNTLTVRCGEVGTMYADPMRTRQILLNLLGNATKFTHHGAITLSASRRTIDGVPSIEFAVADTGVGMTPQQAETIFEAFTQANADTSRTYGGTGLGLALVSRFCQLMGGQVGVESAPGRGSRFTVHLPIEVVASAGDTVAA
jgi:signal transduction histidine kinase